MGELPASGDQAKLADQVRMNIAFEQMVMSVLTGAVVGGVMTFFIGLASAAFTASLSLSTLLSVLLNMVLVSFLIFLVGFFASVIVGAPLFVALERAKRRSLWPYLAAALAVAIGVFSVLRGGLPVAEDFGVSALASVFFPAIVTALVFARRMQSFWRAAERTEAVDTNIMRLN